MDDSRLDKMLTELRSENNVPSDELILKTKSRIRKSKNINLIILVSLIFNILSVFILSYIIFFTSINIVLKICAYSLGSTIINLLILTVYLGIFDYLRGVTNKVRKI